MILTKLKEYADTQMELPPAMYNKRTVAWVISLTADGEFEDCICWKGSTKDTKNGRAIIAPDIGRTVGVKPKLLTDTGEYVLGIGRPTTKPERLADCHEQFKALTQRCAEETGEEIVKAVTHFLHSPNAIEAARTKLLKEKQFDPGETITFRVGGKIPANADEKFHRIEQFWASHTSGGEAEDAKTKSPIMTCLVTGEETSVEQRLPFLVKGLFGGQPSGTALVSANASAFTSYGLQNSLTSPISRDAAERFTKALNHLLSNSNSRLSIGTTAYIFWTQKPDDFDVLAMLDKPDPQAVKNLMESPFSGQQVYGTDANQFYALALSASVARAVVRDWLETTIPMVQENLKRWFRDQKIVDAYGEDGKPLGVYSLAASAFRDPAKEMLPAVPTALVRTALQNIRLPDDLLAKLVRRNRAEREVNYPRASLIKLILTTQKGEEAMSNMDKLNPSPNLEGKDSQAYQCGRLLAELEALQRAAIGKVNASLTDRYYGAASSTPATAFPSLMRNRQAHLSKLRKSKMGTFLAIDERIEEITSYLPTFPKTLNMQQQGLFALGYYHQRAHNRASAKALVPAASA
jgi:CRISPR-associated protein Csd1